LARGFTATAITHVTGYSAYWIGQIARRYNAHGPESIKDQRYLVRPHRQLLTAAHCDELRAALSESAPLHDHWNGRSVAAWMAQRLARLICRPLGRVYLRRLGARLFMPRPRYVRADPQAQKDFKARLRPLLRQVRQGHGIRSAPPGSISSSGSGRSCANAPWRGVTVAA
jgi:transposase